MFSPTSFNIRTISNVDSVEQSEASEPAHFAISSRFSIEIPPFIPSEDPLDQRVKVFIELGYMDTRGFLTPKFYETFENPPALEEKKVQEIRRSLIENRIFRCGPFQMGELLKTLCSNAQHYAQSAMACYVGSGVKKMVLGKEYFALFLRMISDGQLEELDVGILKELSRETRDEDYFILLENPQEGSLKCMVDETIHLLAKIEASDYATIRHAGLENRKIQPNFSLVSWKNQFQNSTKKAQVCDLVFSFKRDRCVPEKELCIVLNPHLSSSQEKIFYPVGAPLESGNGYENASQGIVDFITRIVHGKAEDLNEQMWPMLIALISQERRFYELEEGKAESLIDALSLKLMEHGTETVLDGVRTKLINYLKEHHPNDQKMTFTMACNACLCLRKFFPATKIHALFLSLVDSIAFNNPYSPFALIKEGVLQYQLSFLDVMHIQACFATLSFGVKNPTLRHDNLCIFLTKFEEKPSVKILEDSLSVFIPFDPLVGYRICLDLSKNEQLQEYFNQLLRAYSPLNAYSENVGSQLSPYPRQLIEFLDPLQSEIRKNGFGHNPFVSKLSYKLLVAMQTSQVSQVNVLKLLKYFPFVFDTDEHNDLLIEHLEALLNQVSPWNAWSAKMFGNFKALKTEGRKTIPAWIQALIGTKSTIAAELTRNIWEKAPKLMENENFSMKLIYHLSSISLQTTLHMFSQLMETPVKNQEKRTLFFIKLGLKVLQDKQCEIKDLMKFLESGKAHYTSENLELRRQCVELFMKVMQRLISSKNLAYARELLLNLTEKNILEKDHPDVMALWRDCLGHILSQEQFKELGLAFWNDGKQYKVWQDKESNLKNALLLAEYLAEKETPSSEEFPKILNYVCTSHAKDERIHQLVLVHIQQQGGIGIVRKVPSAYLPHLLPNEKIQILLNALAYEIKIKNIDESLVIVNQILNGNPCDGQDFFQDLTNALIQEIISTHGFRYLEGIQKMIAHETFVNHFEKDFKVNCLLDLVKSFSADLMLEQFSLPLQNLLITLMKETLDDPSYAESASFCLNLLQKFTKLPPALKRYIENDLIQLLRCSYVKAQPETFFALIQLCLHNNCLEVSQEELELFALEVLKDAPHLQVIQGIHDLCKAYFKVDRIHNEKTIVLFEKLIWAFFSKPAAFYWAQKLTSTLSHLSPSQLELCVRLSGFIESSQENELLENLYQKNVDWLVFAKALIAQGRYHSIFHLIQQHGKKVSIELKDVAKALLLNFPLNVNFASFLSIVEHGKIEEIKDWIVFSEKILQFKSKDANESFYHLFVKKVINNKQFPATLQEKAECLMRMLPFFTYEQWMENVAIFTFFENVQLRVERIAFYNQIFNGVISLLDQMDAEIAHNLIQGYQKLYRKIKKEDRLSFELADSKIIEFLVHHISQNMALLGCKALKERLLDGENQIAEKFFIALIKRCQPEENNLRQEIIKLLNVYQKLTSPHLLNRVIETMASNQNIHVEYELSCLILRFISGQSNEIPQDFYLLLIQQMSVKESEVLKKNLEILEEKNLEHFLTRAEINLLYVKWLSTKLLASDTGGAKLNAARLFYDNFERYQSFPQERQLCLLKISEMIFSMDLNNKNYILFHAFLTLYLTEKPIPKIWGKIPENSTFTSPRLIYQQLFPILGNEAPSTKDPIFIERYLAFMEVMFDFNFSEKCENPDFLKTFKICLSEFTKIYYLIPKEEKKRSHCKQFIRHLTKFIYSKACIINKQVHSDGMDVILGDAVMAGLFVDDENLYHELFLWVYDKWPKCSKISEWQQACIAKKILNRMINDYGVDGLRFFDTHHKTFLKDRNIYFESLTSILNVRHENSYMDLINYYTLKIQTIFLCLNGHEERKDFFIKLSHTIIDSLEERLNGNNFIQIGLYYLSTFSQRHFFDNAMGQFYILLKKIGKVMIRDMKNSPHLYVDNFFDCLFQNYQSTDVFLPRAFKIKLREVDFYLKELIKVLPSSNQKLRQKILSREIESIIPDTVEGQFVVEAELLKEFIELFASCPENMQKRGLYVLKAIQRYFIKHPNKKIEQLGRELILFSYKNLMELLEHSSFEVYETNKVYVLFLSYFIELRKNGSSKEIELIEDFDLCAEMIKSLFNGTYQKLHDRIAFRNFYHSIMKFFDEISKLGSLNCLNVYCDILDYILSGLIRDVKFIKFKEKEDQEFMEFLLSKIFIPQLKKNEVTEELNSKINELRKKWLIIYEKNNKLKMGIRFLSKYEN